MGYHEISFLSYFMIGTCIFSASQIGRQDILRKLNWPACRLQPAISHPWRCVWKAKTESSIEELGINTLSPKMVSEIGGWGWQGGKDIESSIEELGINALPPVCHICPEVQQHVKMMNGGPG